MQNSKGIGDDYKENFRIFKIFQGEAMTEVHSELWQIPVLNSALTYIQRFRRDY
jgi:hypothetical protein